MALAPPAKKRNVLSLEKKVQVTKTMESNRGMNVRSLSEKFSCGKSQIAYILKNKASILSIYEANVSGSRAHVSHRATEYSSINEALYQWYTIACSKNIYPSGPQLIEKAKEIAARLSKPNFNGSNGWLENWKNKYNIRQVAVCGESGDVHGETVDS